MVQKEPLEKRSKEKYDPITLTLEIIGTVYQQHGNHYFITSCNTQVTIIKSQNQ